jgi:NAD(P) transhydrogenase subunit beta
VIFGAFGTPQEAAGAKSAAGLTVRSITVEDAAIQMAYARLVIVVPGYGMAVAQAQHQARELAEQVEKRGGEVKYAIHPVAGRMPRTSSSTAPGPRCSSATRRPRSASSSPR